MDIDNKLLEVILESIKDIKGDIKEGFGKIQFELDDLKMGNAELKHCSTDLRDDLNTAFEKIRELESRTRWLEPTRKLFLWVAPIVALAVAGYVGKTVIPMVLKQEIQKVVVLPKTDTTGSGKK